MKTRTPLVSAVLLISITLSACRPPQTTLDMQATPVATGGFATQTTEVPTFMPAPAIMPTNTATLIKRFYDDILYYGSEVADARLDIYLPRSVEPPYPTVVYVTPPANTNEDLLLAYTAHLMEQGYAAVAIKIRPQHMFPDSFCGLAWVHANAGHYGFDTQHIAAFGVSGSGIPTALFGTLDQDLYNPFMEDCPYPEPEGPWVQGVVTYEAVLLTPVGLKEELIRSDGARFSGLPRETVDAIYDQLIQRPPTQWRDIADADPEHRWFIQSFPLYWLDGREPPFLLIYGAETGLSWMKDEQQFFASQLEAVGVPVVVIEKEGLRHSVGALAGHTEEMDAFLAEIFGGADSIQLQMLEPITLDNVAQIEPLAAFEQDTVCTAAFSPDGKWLASGEVGAIVLRNVADSRVLNTLATGYAHVYDVAFSSNATYLVATSSGNCGLTNVRVWDVGSGELLLQRLDDFGHLATGVALSPDGTLVAAGTGCAFDVRGSASVKVWDIASGDLLLDIAMPSFVRDVAFSPDGALLAAATGKGTISLWEVPTGVLRTELHGHTDGVSGVAFSPDGTWLASAGGVDARLWDVVSGEQLHLFEGPAVEVIDIAFSADGRLIVMGGHALEFWDPLTGAQLAVRQIEGKGNYINSVAFNADSTLLATCEHDEILRLWGVPVDSR